MSALRVRAAGEVEPLIPNPIVERSFPGRTHPMPLGPTVLHIHRQALRRNVFSQSVVHAPDSELSFIDESGEYDRRMIVRRGVQDLALRARWSRELGFLPSCRLIVAIPVHAAETQLSRALSCYRELNTRFPETHHVVLLVNGSRPMLSRRAFEVRRRVLEAEVRGTRRRLTGLRISVLQHYFEQPPRIGRVRGLLTDAIIASASSANLEDPILISHDADQMALARQYFETVQNAFARDRRLDAISGPWCHGYGPNGENHLPVDELLPELFLQSRFIKALSDLSEELERGRYCLGSNLAVRLSALCAAGGWDYALPYREDYELAMRLTALRAGHAAHRRRRRSFRYDPGLYVVTSPRRVLKWLLVKDDERPAVVWSTTAGRFDSPSEVRRYLTRVSLLQSADIVRAMRGDEGAMRKIQDRVLFNARAIRFDTHPDMTRLARRLGIHGRLIHHARGSMFEIDWEKSPIIGELFRWTREASVNKNSGKPMKPSSRLKHQRFTLSPSN